MDLKIHIKLLNCFNFEKKFKFGKNSKLKTISYKLKKTKYSIK